MRVLVDTSIWVRFEDKRSKASLAVQSTLERYASEQTELLLCAQVIIEFWAVASRPKDANGLGFNRERTRQAISKMQEATTLLTEPPDIAERWLGLAERYGPIGKPAHDLRLVALMQAHGVATILTLNTTDFRRYEEVKVIEPSN